MSNPDAYQISASAAWWLTVVSCVLGLSSGLIAIIYPPILKPSAIFLVTAGLGITWMMWIGDEARVVEITEIYD